ncbi:dihydroxyacetone kinase subunit DhaL [Salibacterium halotolerans]|uniref:phosphoenolpyruvate--glycerone phosphotransferase n=1 Tax=Salibacterium halotolerans TaxID=1884432 RepID=A0A1I5PML0_9BACI|nr:dihydroxyacetone kinase subunit DhaL [Salibacterium halotolerans]SFP35127.1 dihydroxyacetone kinase, C-terminal domain [Salibacterium halotolerans]
MIQETEWKRLFERAHLTMEENKDYLCELDRPLGDGDHGVTMSMGWKAVSENIREELEGENDCGKIASTSGRTFLSAVGSSVGPLYASGFMEGAKRIKQKNDLSDEDLRQFWLGFINGVQKRSGADSGDKTMMDVLYPIQKVLNDETIPVESRFEHALWAAEQGMEATKHMISHKGRSSRLGERSLGFQDPGATSMFLLFSTFVTQATESRNAHL